jgi:hypothetical protein
MRHDEAEAVAAGIPASAMRGLNFRGVDAHKSLPNHPL